MLIPMVIESTKDGERSYDLWSKLLKDRIVFLGAEINDQIANIIIAQLLFLEKEDPEADVQFYINSPGGDVYAGLSIMDVMNHIKCPVATTCVGMAASMGSILLAAGEKGKRMILPNSRVMIHQVSAGFRGTVEDINIQAKETNDLMDILMDVLSKHTGKTVEEVRKDCSRDKWMSATDALNYGIVDEILNKEENAKP